MVTLVSVYVHIHKDYIIMSLTFVNIKTVPATDAHNVGYKSLTNHASYYIITCIYLYIM